MFGKIIDFIGRRMFSDRERSEGLLRALYQRSSGRDLDETLSPLGVSPEKVSEMFDDFHHRFAAELLSSDPNVARPAHLQALTALLRKIDAFNYEHDMRRCEE